MGRRGCALGGFCMLAIFMGIEGWLRRGEEARSLDAGAQDRGTTSAVGASFGIALFGGPFFALRRRGRLSTHFGWTGVGIMACSLALRVAAVRTLGSHYTRTLRTGADQGVVTDGPYRYVRHPGYAATLGMWLGFGLALTSVPAAIVTTLPNITSYLWRIDVEEAMLVESFGESYRAYQRATWRLIPAVY